jgi:hypothetical protein
VEADVPKADHHLAYLVRTDKLEVVCRVDEDANLA